MLVKNAFFKTLQENIDKYTNFYCKYINSRMN